MTTAPAVKAPASQRSHWPWALAAIVALFILTAGLLAYYVIHRMFGYADSAGQGLALNLASQNTYNIQINSALGVIKHTPKLIVNTYEVDVEIQEAVSSNWAYVYWGTTAVTIRSHRNKIQYYIPVDSLSTGNFTYDPDHKILHALIPLPRIDEDVVEVQSNPSLIDIQTSLGWASTDSGAGKQVRDDAMNKLRAAVIAAGKGEAQQALAEKDARKNFARLLDPVVETLGPDIKVEVDFEPPVPAH
jgi:hypothetical protein